MPLYSNKKGVTMNFKKYSKILEFFDKIIDDENQHFYKRYLSIIQYNRLAAQCGLKPRPENKIDTF
tara:strand:+ start:1798 stop:1995 length:198 start_codon:yes stop_codon:yes gene_type:complete